jgi:hypothetical protein
VRFPPVSSLVEPFNTLAPQMWYAFNDGTRSTASADGGFLVLEKQPTVTGGAGIITEDRYSLVDSGCSIELTDVTQMARLGESSVFFNLQAGPQEQGLVGIGFSPGALGTNTGVQPNISYDYSTPINYQTMRYLRILHQNTGDAGVIVYQYSQDGGSFTTFRQLPAPYKMTDVRVVIGLYVNPSQAMNNDAGVRLLLDNVNRLP